MAKALFDASAVAEANLREIVPVVTGAVVSKPLIDTKGCKVIAFAMDAGQAISEHHAPYVATVHVLHGRLQFGVAGRQLVLGPHDWLVMPADEKHDLQAVEPVHFVLTLVKQ